MRFALHCFALVNVKTVTVECIGRGRLGSTLGKSGQICLGECQDGGDWVHRSRLQVEHP
jgi:hypothetical protein